MTFGHRLHFELADFAFMQKQFAAGFGVMVEPVAEIVFINVGIVKVEFALIDLGKGVPYLPAPGTQRFYFGPFEDDARLVSFQDEVIPAGFGVADDIRHKKQSLKVEPRTPLPALRQKGRLSPMLAPEVGRIDRSRVLEFCILPGEFIHDELSQSDVGPAIFRRISDGCLYSARNSFAEM